MAQPAGRGCSSAPASIATSPGQLGAWALVGPRPADSDSRTAESTSRTARPWLRELAGGWPPAAQWPRCPHPPPQHTGPAPPALHLGPGERTKRYPRPQRLADLPPPRLRLRLRDARRLRGLLLRWSRLHRRAGREAGEGTHCRKSASAACGPGALAGAFEGRRRKRRPERKRRGRGSIDRGPASGAAIRLTR